MINKDGTHTFITKFFKICSTFLIVGIVLFNTVVVGSAAKKYSSVNDTVYKSADAFALEELPYGEDTGVIQFQYGSNYLTIYFDKFTIYDEFYSQDYQSTCLQSYFWNANYVVNDDGSYDYELNIESNSPIYYKLSYDSSHVFSSTIGQQKLYEVAYIEEYYEISGAPFPIMEIKEYLGFNLTKYKLSSIVPSDWSLTGERRIYSNVYQVRDLRYGDGYYRPVKPAAGQLNFVNGTSVGYNVEYYPSYQYLQNAEIRSTLVDIWEQSISLEDVLRETNGILYSIDYYLSELWMYVINIDVNVSNINGLLESYLPLYDVQLSEIIELLEGPAYDSSQGLGSNTEFGDAVGGLMQDTEAPSIDISGIESNLGNSFLFIRTMFDRVLNEFNLSYVVIFLLGMSFIAYTLGRAISNRMNR